MKKTALLYSFNTQKTARAAKMVREAFGDGLTELNIEELSTKEFQSYDNYIMGVPTWWDGELPNYWDEFLPDLEELKLKGKTFALYGAGDSKGYPENFVDAIGILGEVLENGGGKLVGFTKNEGFEFESSKALRGNEFCGLPLDFENHPRKVKPNIQKWIEQLKKEFK